MSQKQSSHSFFWGFVAGAAATAVYTLLKTPRSGRETIDQIRGQANQMLGRSQSAASGWQEPFQTTASTWQSQAERAAKQAQAVAQDTAGQVQEQVADVVEAGQEAASDAVESAKEALEP